MVDSSATTARPVRRASATSGCSWMGPDGTAGSFTTMFTTMLTTIPTISPTVAS